MLGFSKVPAIINTAGLEKRVRLYLPDYFVIIKVISLNKTQGVSRCRELL